MRRLLSLPVMQLPVLGGEPVSMTCSEMRGSVRRPAAQTGAVPRSGVFRWRPGRRNSKAANSCAGTHTASIGIAIGFRTVVRLLLVAVTSGLVATGRWLLVSACWLQPASLFCHARGQW